MEEDFYAQVPPRRESEPHHHHQPKYPDPEYRPRRHTDGGALRKMHSRREDYMNKTPPTDMVSYICFDDENHPVECDEVDLGPETQPETKMAAQTDLDRVDSAASRGSSNITRESEYDGDADSEDDLTLPACYQHDVASREYDSWPKHQTAATPAHARPGSNSPPRRHHSPHSPTRHDVDPAAQHDMSRDYHHKQQYTDAYRRHRDDERRAASRRDRPEPRRESRYHRRDDEAEPPRHSASSLSVSPTTSRTADRHYHDYHDYHDRRRDSGHRHSPPPPPSSSREYERSHSQRRRRRPDDDDDDDDDDATSSRSPSPPPRRHSSTGSAHGDNLIAQVAQHLAQHRDEYKSLSGDRQGGRANMVSELLGQVMRKIEDGGLDGDMMREVVREVQHVL